MIKRVVSERVWQGRQSWNYEWTGRHAQHMIRVSIRRTNTYEYSQGHVDVFATATLRWERLLTVPINLLPARTLSPAQAEVTASRFEPDLKFLLAETTEILAVTV